ncbi:PREDICTED: protein disulfide isomerase-like 1-5 isoform X4 [Brassica oleracea var. oleracea]|uniref:protein disulfide isomerase-like 1-5 isoform X4 n=1 Tax=Brassica oleracea var. oleracea TaxID=109376 RepID=UPI0006A729E5|nr:PREDICTED: protein disulfide isomerase-like 1-5 isoform X4 [Brassica oleracea var. oleracea]
MYFLAWLILKLEDGSYQMEIILEFLGKNKFSLLTKMTEKIFPKVDDFQNQAQPLEDLARRLAANVFTCRSVWWLLFTPKVLAFCL